MEEKTPSPDQTLSPWSQGIALLKAIKVQLVYLSLVGMAIPLFVFELITNRLSLDLSINISQLHENTTLFTFIDTWSNFFSNYVILTIISYMIAMISYFALIDVCWSYLSHNKTSAEPLYKIWLRNIKLLPRALLSTAILTALVIGMAVAAYFSSILGQFITIILLATLALAYAIPLLLWLGERPWPAIRKSLGLAYAMTGKFKRWALFFQIMTFHIIAIVYVMFFSFVTDKIRHLDEVFGFARSFAYSPDSWPESPMFFLSGIFLQATSSLIIASFVAITTNFFFTVSDKHYRLETS